MSEVLALTVLYNRVIERFESEQNPVPNPFGWTAPPGKLVVGPRITWYPGDPNGALGNLSPPKQPGRNPRPIATLEELFTVEIHGEDNTQPRNEIAQYTATRLLFDTWWRAVYLVARGTVKLLNASWLQDHKGNQNGACIRAVCTIEAMIPDAVRKIAETDTRAVIDVEKLDHSEVIEVPLPPES